MKLCGLKVTVVFILIILTAGCAGIDGSSGGLVDKFDVNGDDKVSRVEYSHGVRSSAFDKADENDDGVIEWEEWKKLDRSPEARQHFDAMDENKDGRVVMGEFMRSAATYSDVDNTFISLDQSHDGFLSHGELTKFDGVSIFSVKF